ncbi:ribokinase [Alteromonadaceae bacterium BrNp21-10]|nr:ribokinase [Alteromonadaceae bacterium BrNp21-10]
MKIFNFGSINIDHVYQVPHLVKAGETLSASTYQTVLGGKGANQSIAIALAGAEVQHIGKLCILDEQYKEQMQKIGVDCQHIQLVDEASGHAMIQVDSKGENAIVLYAGANQSNSEQELKQALSTAEEDDWLLLQNETNNVALAIEVAHQQGLQVAYNPAPVSAQAQDVDPQHVDLLFVNQVEAAAISDCDELGDQIQYFAEHWPHTDVILTLGKEGALWLHQQQVMKTDAFDVTPVDTTAAGDTFIGFFLAGFAQGQDVETALYKASAAAAICVQCNGASCSIPSLEQVELLLSEIE